MIMSHFYVRLLLVLCLASPLLISGGCAGLSGAGNLPETTEVRTKVVGNAVAQIGSPYRYDGADRKGFDDSGLVYFAFEEAGYKLPRQHEGQVRSGQPRQFADAEPGDLLFYRYDDGSKNELHVGVYMGNGQMVHASLNRDEVVNDLVDVPFWFERLVAVIKILP